MKKATKELIKEIAKFIDKDKYNPILISRGYDEYLEKVLIKLVEQSIGLG